MATVRDVAQRAGVAPSTVSRYLNGQLRLTPLIAERIGEAIATLQYVPHAVARNLATGESRTIGLIVPGVTNPFFAFVAEEVEALASAHGYSLLLCNTKGLAEREGAYVDLLSRGGIADGFIYVGMHPRNARLGAAIQRGCPIIVVDERIDGVPPVSTVFVDNYGGAFAATQHLLELGHRRIALSGGREDLMTTRERHAGYRAALEVAGLDVDPALAIFASYSEEAGHDAFVRFRALPDPPTAIFATADAIALGLYAAAAEHGLRIPDDLSVVGFDDIPVAQRLGPPLTTVRQPLHLIGQAACDLLLRRLQERDDTPHYMVLPVDFIVRHSASAPSATKVIHMDRERIQLR